MILDAVCLLFGIIPGIIAFAVDFRTGAIYLPSSKAADGKNYRIVKFDPDQYTKEALEALISKETGRDFRFTDDRLRMIELDNAAEIPGYFTKFHEAL